MSRPRSTSATRGRASVGVGVALALMLTACAGEAAPNKKQRTAPAATQTAEPGADTPVARIGDATITLAEVDEAAASGLIEARQQMYQARAQALDQMINERLVKEEAARRGLEEEDLVRIELQEKITPPTDAEIEAFYFQNQAMMRGTLDELRDRIAMHLEQEAMGERAQAFIGGLRESAGVKVMLEAPRVHVDAKDSPRWGKADAPVEIVKFSDFECGYCTRAAETMEEVKAHYGDKITLVYRHFPLPNHPRAHRAAEASQCADDQGKFWDYANELFTNQRAMGEDDLRSYATNVGLDGAAFETCLSSGKHKATVDRDIEDGRAVGMSGTPGFYVNGRVIGGAQPFEVFKEVIDEELARAGS